MNLRNIPVFLITAVILSIASSLHAFENDVPEKGKAPHPGGVRAKEERAPGALESFARRFGLGNRNGADNCPASDAEAMEESFRPFSGCIIDTITVTGNRYTDRRTIIREMATRQGDRLDEALVIRDNSYIRGMGFFSTVEITVHRVKEERCSVDVRVEERPGLFMKYPFPTVDYSIDRGITYGFRWRIKNFRGVGEDLLMTYRERSDKERGGGVTWLAPWLGDFRLRASMSLFSYFRIEKPQTADFIKVSNGVKIAVGFPLTGSMIRQLWFTPELVVEERVSRMTIPGNTVGPEGIFFRQLLLSCGLNLVYDSRDNLVAPFRGVYAGVDAKRLFSLR